ncbi:peptidase [Nocardioides humilatus]|uniref:Peptidase n=1 Tax=Nocardioides humilatus TaxID=2607660 RepID=A0A5B1L3Z4_9ACTN|nr:peptidase [Nocardioides humilatus]
MEVTLRQDTSAQVGDGTLPGVGSNVSWWLLASAVASILGGVALVAVARGRRRDEQA